MWHTCDQSTQTSSWTTPLDYTGNFCNERDTGLCLRCVKPFPSLWLMTMTLTPLTTGLFSTDKPNRELVHEQDKILVLPWWLCDEFFETMFCSVSNNKQPQKRKASFSGWSEYMHGHTVTGSQRSLLTVSGVSFVSGCWTGSKTHTMLP